MRPNASSPDAEYFVNAIGSRFTVVHSSGKFTTFDVQPVENGAAGFIATIDGQSKVAPPSAPGEALDIGLTRFEAPDGHIDCAFTPSTAGQQMANGRLGTKRS
jgi:hypothetical protein